MNGYDIDQLRRGVRPPDRRRQGHGRYRGDLPDADGRCGGANFGYYSEQEFDFAPYEALRGQIAELGRACIHRDHRSTEVLNLLWRGLARYVLVHGGRYMMGCCSLNSQDAAEGNAVYESLKNYRVAPELRTKPTVPYALPKAQGRRCRRCRRRSCCAPISRSAPGYAGRRRSIASSRPSTF